MRSGGSSPQLQLVNEQVHPSVRRGGAPGRRSHTSMTRGAVHFGAPVRIGAGAGRKRSTHTNAATPIGQCSGDDSRRTLGNPRRRENFERGTSAVNRELFFKRVVGPTRHRSRARLHFAWPLVARDQVSFQNTWRKTHDPLDNHHRRCSAWLGRVVIVSVRMRH